MWKPMKPAAPVTRTGLSRTVPSPADADIGKTRVAHGLGVQGVAKVDDQGRLQERRHALPIEIFINRPIGQKTEGVRALARRVRVSGAVDLRQEALGFL